MDLKLKIDLVGSVKTDNGNFRIEVAEQFIPALTELEGFSHLQIIWWGHLYDGVKERKNLVLDKPYKKGPDNIGVFATRSPVRPNPVLLTNIYVQSIDYEKGIIYTPYIDADNDTPVLDIKPYSKNERIKNCSVPDWCKHWPEWYEDAAAFDWDSEFNF